MDNSSKFMQKVIFIPNVVLQQYLLPYACHYSYLFIGVETRDRLALHRML